MFSPLKHYCYLLNPMKSPWNHQYSFLNHYCSLSNPVKISLFSLKKKDLPQPRTQQHSLESPDPGLVVQSKLTFSSAFREGEAKAALRPDLESRGGNPGGKWHIPWAIIKQQHHINILYIYIISLWNHHRYHHNQIPPKHHPDRHDPSLRSTHWALYLSVSATLCPIFLWILTTFHCRRLRNT